MVSGLSRIFREEALTNCPPHSTCHNQRLQQPIPETYIGLCCAYIAPVVEERARSERPWRRTFAQCATGNATGDAEHASPQLLSILQVDFVTQPLYRLPQNAWQICSKVGRSYQFPVIRYKSPARLITSTPAAYRPFSCRHLPTCDLVRVTCALRNWILSRTEGYRQL